MSGVDWDSPDQRLSEWAYAQRRLRGCTNGTKLRRKDNPHLKHSFIVMDGKIMAMAPMREYLGQGFFGHAKLCEEADGKLWAVKISALTPHALARLHREESIVRDLGLGLQATTREPFLYFFGSKKPKHYLVMHYLGKSLQETLKQDLSETQRYELAINLLSALLVLHSGSQSKEHKRYAHGDIALRNFTIDDAGTVHLIDFGLSYDPSPSQLNIEYGDPFYSDARRITGVIRSIFTDRATREAIEYDMQRLINQTNYFLVEQAKKDNETSINKESSSLYVERLMEYFSNKLAVQANKGASL